MHGRKAVRCVVLSAFRVSVHDTFLYLPVVSQCPAELEQVQQVDGTGGTEELVQAVPNPTDFIYQLHHINKRGFLDGIAADAPDEPLTGASPLVDLSIESGKLLIRQMDDDLVAYPIRRGKVYQRAQDRNLHLHAGALTASGCQQNGAAEHLLQRNKPQDGNWSHRAEGVRTVDFGDTLTAIL